MKSKMENYKGKIPEDLSDILKNLIKSCWDIKMYERPDSTTIYNILIEAFNSQENLLPNVNKEEVDEYIRKLAFYRNMYDEIRYLMNQIKEKKSIAQYELCSIFYEGKYLPKNIKKKEMVKSGEIGQIYIYENEQKIIGKILYVLFDNYIEEEKIKIMTNLSIVLQINHSCICRCLGFYPYGFHNEKHPIIFNEYMKNGSLFDIINNKVDGWNDTMKLINIYGIALGMSYLHSHDLLHQNLNTKNILEDENLYPKINNYCISQIFSSIQSSSKTLEVTPFSAPEMFTDGQYTKSSEVYSFGMIVYSIMTNQNPNQKNSQYKTLSQIIEGNISKINKSIPRIYKNLIDRCLSKNPEERPTFNDIVYELQNKHEYLIESIDAKKFRDYIEYTKSFQSNNGLIEPCPEQVIKDWLKNKQEKKYEPNYKEEEEEEEEYRESSFPFFPNINTLELKNLRQIKYIKKGGFGTVYKVRNKITNDLYAAKVLNIPTNITQKINIQFIHEIICHSQAKNETIAKFIGYNRHYFYPNLNPVIFTEYINNGDLRSILKKIMKDKKIENWNDTTKLIIIYGIAYCMFYLHSIGILHRDLNPSNVLLDDSLFPKICDFGLSISDKDYSDDLKDIINKNHANDQPDICGTPGFVAPEIYINNQYSEASDVYSFAILVYEILTASDPYEKFEHYQIMYSITYSNQRPLFIDGIDENYWDLIESCWKKDPKERPTFADIVEDLRNPKFITKDVDKKAFDNYINYIQKSSL